MLSIMDALQFGSSKFIGVDAVKVNRALPFGAFGHVIDRQPVAGMANVCVGRVTHWNCGLKDSTRAGVSSLTSSHVAHQIVISKAKSSHSFLFIKSTSAKGDAYSDSALDGKSSSERLRMAKGRCEN
ncbi:MAG TPA: hypothetical protein VIK39_03410 [Candidatus Angelobacter sp.]